MKPKAVIPRKRALRDVDEAIKHYLGEGAPQAALGFIEALQRAYAHIARNPGLGSSTYAVELNLPGLCFWRLRTYPYLIVYVERADHIDVWCVLHGERDIPTGMQLE